MPVSQPAAQVCAQPERDTCMLFTRAKGGFEGADRTSKYSVQCRAGLALHTVSAAQAAVRPKPGGGAGTLTVVDNRTGKKYEIKVT